AIRVSELSRELEVSRGDVDADRSRETGCEVTRDAAEAAAVFDTCAIAVESEADPRERGFEALDISGATREEPLDILLRSLSAVLRRGQHGPIGIGLAKMVPRLVYVIEKALEQKRIAGRLDRARRFLSAQHQLQRRRCARTELAAADEH